MPRSQVNTGFWRALFDDVVEDDISSLAAAIAYYTTLSLAPLILLTLTFIGMFYPDAQERYINGLGGWLGSDGQEVIETIAQSAFERPDLRQWAGWVGVALLLFSASAILAQLQMALNRIWGMDQPGKSGLWGYIQRRLLSTGVLLALIFLTIVTLVLQAAVMMVPHYDYGVARLIGWALDYLLYSILFTSLYRWLPNGRIPWWTAFRGGLITTAFFLLGHALVVFYLSQSHAGAAFGTTGAILVWLIWAYYSGIAFLISAEIIYGLAHSWKWVWWEDLDVKATDLKAGTV